MFKGERLNFERKADVEVWLQNGLSKPDLEWDNHNVAYDKISFGILIIKTSDFFKWYTAVIPNSKGTSFDHSKARISTSTFTFSEVRNLFLFIPFETPKITENHQTSNQKCVVFVAKIVLVRDSLVDAGCSQILHPSWPPPRRLCFFEVIQSSLRQTHGQDKTSWCNCKTLWRCSTGDQAVAKASWKGGGAQYPVAGSLADH